MTHALAEATVLVEQFIACSTYGGVALACPACAWSTDPDAVQTQLGELLTAARRHILEDHAGHNRPDHEHAYTTVLHAVDNLTGETFPGFVPEVMPGERCENCEHTVRGPLLRLWQPDQPLRMVCATCMHAHRRTVSHVADQLPMPPTSTFDQEGAELP